MCILALAEKNLKFEALESLITSNDTFGLSKEKEEERKPRKRELQLGWIRRTEFTKQKGPLPEAPCAYTRFMLSFPLNLNL
jgi:hypothetical protein